jgi:hypothetical protein
MSLWAWGSCGKLNDFVDESLDGEALAAAARGLGIGVVEHEAGGEIVLAPIHDAAG